MTIYINIKKIFNKISHPLLTYKSSLYIEIERCFHNLKTNANSIIMLSPQRSKTGEE